MQVIVDKLPINYLVLGSGNKTALFLHGWADSIKTYESLAKQFVKENPDFKALLVDLPGFGASKAPTEAWGLEEFALFVRKFLIKTDMSAEVIVGHSNGGAIAISGIAKDLYAPSGLVLIGSAGIRPKTTRNAALKLASLPAKFAIMLLPSATQKRIKQKMYGAIGSDYMVSEHLQESFKKVVATDVQSAAAKISTPTCIIYGANDASTPPEYGKQFNEVIKNSQLTVLPDAGHFVHQEQVYKVATIMTEFVKNI